MLRTTPLITGEVYHIYNRGAHKQAIFTNDVDRNRFLLLLYIANNTERIHLGNLLQKYKGRSWMEIYKEVKVDKSLVDIFAYSLMPNHFHVLLRQKTDGSITVFMKKLATAYSMYFNTKYEHSGVLFQGRFKSKHVGEDDYFRYLFSYIHLNPAELIEPKWKEQGVSNVESFKKFMTEYVYSSHNDYIGAARPERAIISFDEAPDFVKTHNSVDELLQNIKDGPGY